MIKLHEISCYLPYKVKAIFSETNKKNCTKEVIDTVSAMYDNGSIVCYNTVNSTPDRYKLILRPLSDLIRQIEHNGDKFVPIVELYKLITGYKVVRCEYNFRNNYTVSAQILPNTFVENQLSLNHLPLIGFQKLFEWHFDVYELIERNLAIDINTLKDRA